MRVDLDRLPSWLVPTIVVVCGGLLSWQVTLAEVKQELKDSTRTLEQKIVNLEINPPAQMPLATVEALGSLRGELQEVRSDVRELRAGQLEILRYLRERPSGD